MPKIKTIKLNVNRSTLENDSRSTYQGDFNFALYYDARDSFFYFDYVEVGKSFPNITYNIFTIASFRDCKTEQQAIDFLSFYILENKTYVPSIKIEISLEGIDKPATDLIKKSSGLNLKFERILVVNCGTLKGTQTCNENFKPLDRPFFRQNLDKNIIPYTDEVWDFLTDTNDKIMQLKGMIYDFFDVDPALLEEKIKSTGQFLLTK